MVIHSVVPRLWPMACSRAAALLNVVVIFVPLFLPIIRPWLVWVVWVLGQVRGTYLRHAVNPSLEARGCHPCQPTVRDRRLGPALSISVRAGRTPNSKPSLR